jgi:hypothetical protein
VHSWQALGRHIHEPPVFIFSKLNLYTAFSVKYTPILQRRHIHEPLLSFSLFVCVKCRALTVVHMSAQRKSGRLRVRSSGIPSLLALLVQTTAFCTAVLAPVSHSSECPTHTHAHRFAHAHKMYTLDIQRTATLVCNAFTNPTALQDFASSQ